MATDFGDDMGEMIFEAIKRAIRNSTYTLTRKLLKNIRDHMQTYYENKGLKEGMTPDQAQQYAKEMSDREQSIVKFGNILEASQMAEVAKQNETYAHAFQDDQQNGYLSFATEDKDNIIKLLPYFTQNLDQQAIERISNDIDTPITKNELKNLQPIKSTNLWKTNEQTPPEKYIEAEILKETILDQPEEPIKTRTQTIADIVKEAKNTSQNIEEFKQQLAQKGVGLTHTKNGEPMVYQPKSATLGNLNPYQKGDWAVSCAKLEKDYGIQGLTDYLTTDGSLDTRGETPDLNQGIKSHDSIDTDTHTTGIEREGQGTDIPLKRYNLEEVKQESRASAKALEKNHTKETPEHDLDPSDKFFPERGR